MKILNFRVNLLLLLCFLVSASTYAQTNIILGPKVGLNLSTFSGKDAENASVRPGVTVGGFLSVSSSARLGFTAEALFSQKGARIRDGVVSTSFTRLNYLEIPLLAKYYFISRTRSIPTIFAGPSINYLINGSSTRKGEGNVTKNYNKYDFGFVLGAGIEMDLEKKWWNIDIRLTPGLQNIRQQTNPLAIRNTVFSLNMALGFGK